MNKLSFSAAILGIGMSRYKDDSGSAITGGFTSNPKGDWIVTKIFLADGEAEVYLNINKRLGRGEFSIKDKMYGNQVIEELARVLR